MMLLLVIYAYAIIFTMSLAGTEVGDGVFDDVLMSMNTLMLPVFCGADSRLILQLLDFGWMYYFTFLTFLLVSNLTLLNMLIAILCDVVSTVSRESLDEAFRKQGTFK